VFKKCFLLILPAIIISCAGGSVGFGGSGGAAAGSAPPELSIDRGAVSNLVRNQAALFAALEELAEQERSGGFVPGLGLAESKLREDTGDYAGAVLAVFKELFWAYSLGAGDVTGTAIRQGLEKLLEPEAPFAPETQKEVAAAVRAILSFFEGRYDDAEQQLAALYGSDHEADGFSRFLRLICALEKGGSREDRSAYSSIRARYAGFPGYWYYLARSANSGEQSAAAEGLLAGYAERCINLAPAGPYAEECRIILASSMGLNPTDASALKTRLEIEAAITEAANLKNPELLSRLLPLAALPDNPSTLYAAGAMRALAGDSLFKNWFIREAEKARGRLAERLHYISRG
jgi:hypothetical protein